VPSPRGFLFSLLVKIMCRSTAPRLWARSLALTDRRASLKGSSPRHPPSSADATTCHTSVFSSLHQAFSLQHRRGMLNLPPSVLNKLSHSSGHVSLPHLRGPNPTSPPMLLQTFNFIFSAPHPFPRPFFVLFFFSYAAAFVFAFRYAFFPKA